MPVPAPPGDLLNAETSGVMLATPKKAIAPPQLSATVPEAIHSP